MPAPTTPAQRAGPRRGDLPNLLVIGFQKCGTSALHYYLDLHPQIRMSSPKEIHYLSGPVAPEVLEHPDEREIVTAFEGNWRRGEAWYRSHFDAAAPVRGEASPGYTTPWYPESAERAAALGVDMRLIALVRDPFEQIPSAWLHGRSLGWERRPFEQVVRPGGMYLERCRYRAGLAPWQQRFGAERLLVVAQQALLADRRRALERVFSFLGVEPGFWDPRMERRRHVSGEKGRRKWLLDRIQRGRPGRLARFLPQELKFAIERGAASRRGPAPPELAPPAAELIADELASDCRWLADEHGIDVSGWLGGRLSPGAAAPVESQRHG